MNDKALIKVWNNKLKKWYYTFVDIKNQEESAVISYNELLKRYKYNNKVR